MIKKKIKNIIEHFLKTMKTYTCIPKLISSPWQMHTAEVSFSIHIKKIRFD